MICKHALTITEGDGYPVGADPALIGMLEAMTDEKAMTEENFLRKLHTDTDRRLSVLVMENPSYKNGYPKYRHGQKHKCEKCGKPVLTGLAKCSKCKTGRTARQNKDIVDRNDFAQLNRSGSRKSTQKENK